MTFFERLFSKQITEKVNKEVEKKPNILKAIQMMPEDYKLEAYIENDEIVIKLKKKEDLS